MKQVVIGGLTFKTIGASLEQSEKVVLYLALGATDSLSTPPFSNPATYLARNDVCVLSLDLPLHSDSDRPLHIAETWSEHTSDLLSFLSSVAQALKNLNKPLGIMGLSRGCLIGGLLAAELNFVISFVGFAPMISLPHSNLFNLASHIDSLSKKNIRFYIGHRDTLVSTPAVVSLVELLMDKSTSQKTSVVLSPSTGRLGHGTLDHNFHEGCRWLIENL